ncbi:hypothetical protein Tco_0753076 [Tanacetum coccineum]
MMSTLVFVDPEISTQADGAPSPRMLIPFPEDPYEAITQAYLVEADTESEPLRTLLRLRHLKDSDMSGARSMPSDFTTPLSPDHPLTHTTPTLVPILRRTARMAVPVPPMMLPGLSASIAEVAAMSDSAFRKRFRSSYESSPSSSPPDLPSRKRYRGTSELVKDEEEDDEREDERREDEEDEGHTAEDEDPAARDEGLAAGDEGPGMRVESLCLKGDTDIPKGQQRAAPVVETAMDEPLGLEPERPERVLALRQPTLTTWIDPEDGRAYIDVPAYPPPTPPIQTPPSPEWSSGSLPISLASSIGSYHLLCLREHEQERVAVTFGAIWRPVLALESWSSQTNAQRASLWHVISDTQMENRELRLQIAEERRARLDLAEIVDSMRRGQEPIGDV